MSILNALLLAIFTAPVDVVVHSVSEEFRNAGDPTDHPVYKQKLQELIDRNKKFEEERERSNRNPG